MLTLTNITGKIMFVNTVMINLKEKLQLAYWKKITNATELNL